MKKAISLLTLLVLLFNCCVAFAGEPHAEPILFRDVEWGSTVKQAAKGLPKGVKMYDTKGREDWYPIDDFMFEDGMENWAATTMQNPVL